MTTFTWKVTNLQHYRSYQGQENVVFKVFWSCIGEETVGEETYQSSWNSKSLLEIDLNESFTAFDQLTEEQVLNWVWGKVNKTEIEINVQTDLDNQKAPLILDHPGPWNQ